MILSARMLFNVSSVNSFEYTNSFEFTEGDAPTIYIQLIDKSLDLFERGYYPTGRRYIPATGAILECTLHNIDDSKKVIRFATQPFIQDGSIWSIGLLPTDKIKGTADLLLTLTEGTKITRGRVSTAIRAMPLIRGRQA